jgi:hypothetical protein
MHDAGGCRRRFVLRGGHEVLARASSTARRQMIWRDPMASLANQRSTVDQYVIEWFVNASSL